MQLPGRLKATTLGDLLGTLHRGRASGTLELVEPNGRVHRVHLACGLVTAVEVDRASASLGEILRREAQLDDDTLRRSLLRAMASRRLHGEVLVREFYLSPDVVDRAVRRQMMLRIQILEDLADAQILFRVTVRPPRGALLEEPLGAACFLAGRRRARDRFESRAKEPKDEPLPPSRTLGRVDSRRLTACRALGVDVGAPDAEIKRVYRRLVRETHPDLHPDATSEERRSLALRFAEVAAAYRTLVA